MKKERHNSWGKSKSWPAQLRLVFLGRSGQDQSWTIHENWYNSNPNLTFLYNSIMILHVFRWGRSKNTLNNSNPRYNLNKIPKHYHKSLAQSYESCCREHLSRQRTWDYVSLSTLRWAALIWDYGRGLLQRWISKKNTDQWFISTGSSTGSFNRPGPQRDYRDFSSGCVPDFPVQIGQ